MTDEARMARIKNAIEAFARQNNIHMQALEPEGGGWASDVAFLLRMLASRDVDIAECARALRQEKDEVERLIKRDAEIERLRKDNERANRMQVLAYQGQLKAEKECQTNYENGIREGRRQMREEVNHAVRSAVAETPDALTNEQAFGWEHCRDKAILAIRTLSNDPPTQEPPQPRKQPITYAQEIEQTLRSYIKSGCVVAPWEELVAALTTHAAAARQAALEEAASVADDLANSKGDFGLGHSCIGYCRRIASAIRALAATPQPEPQEK